jgi:TP901 family phage tail tape measure protein
VKKVFSLFGTIALQGIETVNKSLTGLDKDLKNLSKEMAKTGRQLTKVGSDMTKAFTLPIAAAGAAVIKFGGDFEKAMTTSTAIMGDLSEKMKKDLSDTARTVAKDSTFMAKDVAGAYYYLASAGLDAANSILAIPKVTKFAEAGQFDLKVATDLLTDAQMALGMASKDTSTNMENMTRVSDVLVKANTLANASVQQFSESLTNRAGAALRLLGKDVEEGVAVLAAYASSGVKGAEAGTQLGIVMRDLQKAALSSGDVFKEHNVAVYDDNGEMRNMADIIGDLENALSGMSDEQKKVILSTMDFQEKSIASLLTLIGTSKEIRNYEMELRKAGGTTEDVAKKQIQNFSDQLKILRNKLIDVGIGLSKDLLPILKDQFIPMIESGVKKLSELAAKFNSLSPATKDFIFKALAITAAIGPLLIGLGSFLKILASIRTSMLILNAVFLANPVVLITVGVVALTAALISLNHSTNASVENLKKWNEEAEYNTEIARAMREEWEKNPLFDSAKFKKEFKERWKQYNDETTNSYEQMNVTRQKYLEKEKYDDEKRIEDTKRVGDAKVQITKDQLKEIYEYESKLQDELNSKVKSVMDEKRKKDEEYKENRLNNTIEIIEKEKEWKLADIEENRLLNEEESKWWEQEHQKQMQRIEDEKQAKLNAITQGFNILSQFNQNSEISADNRYKKDQKRIESSTMSEEEKTAALLSLDEKYEKEKNKIRKRQAFIDKAQALFEIGINTAVAVTKSLPNFILAAIVGGLGALQGAAVAARPVPMKDGGVIKSRSGGTIVQAAEAGQDELFLPMKTGAMQLADMVVSRIQSAGKSVASAVAGGGSNSSGINVNVRVNGNFIGNNAAMRDLAVTIGKHLDSEMTRMGAIA